MIFVNKPVPLVSTYQHDISIKTQPAEILTSGMYCLNDYLPNERVWYCMFTTERSFKVYDIRELLGEEYFHQVLNKELSIVLDLSFEPFLHAVDSIYLDVVKKHGIPTSQVIFASNMYDAEAYNLNVAKSLNLDPIKTVWIPTLELMMRDNLISEKSGPAPNTLQLKTYQKKFLNFNRRWRQHRPLMVLLLRYYGLLDKGFVSFGPCEGHGDWNSIWDGLKVSAIGNEEMLNAVLNSEDIKQMEPLYLDIDLAVNQVDPVESTNYYYENTYFSVVSETTFYYSDLLHNSRFLTEKIFKPILHKHPFLIVSIPKSLEVLKKLGYKTFSPYIDESYDQEMDDNKRMMMIIKEIERLCTLSDTDLELFLIESRKICEFNYNVLKNKTKFIIEQ
jgi:hypothetical protein